MYAITEENITLNDCIVEDSSVNCVGCYGGGAYLESETGIVTMSNNTIANNYSKWVGGAWVLGRSGAVNIFNNVIDGNRTDIFAGGLHVNNSSYASISNNIIRILLHKFSWTMMRIHSREPGSC